MNTADINSQWIPMVQVTGRRVVVLTTVDGMNDGLKNTECIKQKEFRLMVHTH